MVQLNQKHLKQNKMKDKKLRVLFYDIETFANQAFVWGKYEQNVIEYDKEWFMLSFAYKWMGDKETSVVSLPDFKLYKRDKEDDKQLVKALWKLFNEADIVIAHNGNSFDQKKTNARFIYHGFPPPEPYKQIDTKLVAKRYFNFNSNKLDDLGNYFGLGRKISTGGFDLWLGCWKGNKKAWKKMCDYNKQDVVLLEKVYHKMLPFMNNHPNLSLMGDKKEGCPNCGSWNITKRGFGYTRTSKYQKWQCKDCCSWHQSPIKGGQVR